MTFNELLQTHSRKFIYIKVLADVLTDDKTANMKIADLKWYIAHNDFYFYKKTFKEVDDLVNTVNKMVKSSSCPHNLANRYYSWKHKYIKRLVEMDIIEKTVESEKLYHFFVRDGHDYHQIKNCFPNGVPNLADETEEYDASLVPVEPFNKEVFKDCIVQIVLFLYF